MAAVRQWAIARSSRYCSTLSLDLRAPPKRRTTSANSTGCFVATAAPGDADRDMATRYRKRSSSGRIGGSRFNGLRMPRVCFSVTCRYLAVVLRSA